jgi:hypothetical protein
MARTLKYKAALAAAQPGNGNGNGNGRREVCTPLGYGATLYPDDFYPNPYPEMFLLIAVLQRAKQDAAWLDALEARAPSTWTLHERRRHTRMLTDVPDPRGWLDV